MTEKTYQVGDVVPWRQVRPGSLVRQGAGDYALRVGDQHHWVRLTNAIHMDWARVGTCGGWLFDDGEEIDEGPVTIIALDVPAGATADDLRTLAEVFEVREAWEKLPFTVNEAAVQYCGTQCGSKAETAFFVRLHRAGWRPGMTAEDAARLLAEQEATCRQ